MSCFQDSICLCGLLDSGDKRVDFINDKVLDLIFLIYIFFFYYSERDKEYFTIAAAQFSN